MDLRLNKQMDRRSRSPRSAATLLAVGIAACTGMTFCFLSSPSAAPAIPEHAGLSAASKVTAAPTSSMLLASPAWGIVALTLVGASARSIARSASKRSDGTAQPIVVDDATFDCEEQADASIAEDDVLPQEVTWSSLGNPCACAAITSSAKAQCVHPDREFPYLCGDCPRN